MKLKIFKFDNVTSTNDIAMNLIKKQKKKSGCIYAKVQTKGRGTYGKKWISNEGNLFASIFFQLKDNYPPFNEFLLINSVIVSELIQHYCTKSKISIKFPNDILINKKKVCGILQEVLTSNKKFFLITGVGINITSNPNVSKDYKTTNILLETNTKPKIIEIINHLKKLYENFFTNLESYSYEDLKKKANMMHSIKC
jgi:BirA family transcriptional regulator, biotin operon repressor / biotin---[acetyl-CoA-carboxylase] ligase